MNYEILYIAPNKYSETEIKVVDAKIISVLTDNKADIIKTDHWGKKKLAYPIKHYDYGYYTLIIFSATGEAIAKITKKLNLNQDVIRFQIVKEVKKSAIIKKEKKAKPIKRAIDKTEKDVKVKTEKLEEKKAGTDKKDAKKQEKIKIDNLDKKLDELLEGTI